VRAGIAAAAGPLVAAGLSRGRKPTPHPHDFAGWIASFRARGLPPSILLCLAMWLALSFYWSFEARNRSEARSSESFGSRQFHLALITAGQLLVLFPIPGLRARFLPVAPAFGAIGVALAASGLLLAVVARRALGRNWSGEVTTKVDHTLVTTGPYALVRHPIYSSVALLYGGTALASGEVHALVGLALVTIAYARKIPMEEKVLSAEFGPAWTDYRNRTKSIIPFVF
jgi:protein-S-isoprenylcysteine O-methyltransferase Ste14